MSDPNTSHGSKSHLEIVRDSESDLHQKVFQLKTLHDVSSTIYGEVDLETIYKNFLLMTMGVFGTLEGLIMDLGAKVNDVSPFVTVGWHGESLDQLSRSVKRCLSHWQATGMIPKETLFRELRSLGAEPGYVLPFHPSAGSVGLLALGRKLVDEAYTPEDDELLTILVNNLLLALRNASSLQSIQALRNDLREKNAQLEAALRGLQSVMRKVELLESIKTKLCKFVPATVTRMLESCPDGHTLEAKEQDVSVLFVDMEGSDKIDSEKGSLKATAVLDRCFSIFMDAIYANNGEVNEAAGEGLMILFLRESERMNALEAVRTAFCIRQDLSDLKASGEEPFRHLVVNMGINSGVALVGATGFESGTGTRCTYTARGTVTNVAARIAEIASGGAILLSRTTAERVEEFFALAPVGQFLLRNVSEEVEVFEVKD